MELGVHFIDFLPGAAKMGPTLAATAKAAEDGGMTMFTVADHFFQMEGVGRAEDPFLECYTSLGFLAGQTQKITLTALVTGVTYRYPVCWRKSSRRWMCSHRAGPCSVSGRRGTSAN